MVVHDEEIISKKRFDELLIGLFVSMELEKGKYIDIVYQIIETNAKVSEYIRNFKFDAKKGYFLSEIVTSRQNGKLSLNRIE